MSEPMSPAGRTILVVDDFEDIRSMMHLWLERHGYRVVEASSGEEAVKAARREDRQGGARHAG